MPAGSLFDQFTAIEAALAGIITLQGSAGAGAPPSGLAGAAALLAGAGTNGAGGVVQQLSAQLPGVLRFDVALSLDGVPRMFTAVRAATQGPPTAVLDGFTAQLGGAQAAIGGNLTGPLQAALDAVRGISALVPPDRGAIAAALLDQILDVLAGLNGPEAERIRAWVRAVQEQHRTFMPLIAEVQAGADPAALLVAVLQRALEGVLDAFGFEQARRLVRFLDDFPANAIPAGVLPAVTAAFDGVTAAFQANLAAAAGGYPQFRDAAVATAAAMQDLKLRLRPVLAALRQIAGAKLFQPGALERELRARIEAALTVPVQEVQDIRDPFAALFDRIDAAIADIDLTVVRDQILTFFTTIRQTIEGVNIPSLGDTLREQIAPVEALARTLEQGITDLINQIAAFFAGLAGQVRSLAENVGSFAPDGAFHFHAEQDLRRVLTAARLAIAGDPANPGAPSVRGALTAFQAAIDGLLGQVSGVLTPVAGSVDQVVTAATDGIAGFATFLQGLDIATLLTTLRDQVQARLDALGAISFDVIVDPVLQGIEENADKLRQIDSSKLNDVLRAALATALDVVINVDFSVQISKPLVDQFKPIKDVPAQALAELQSRYEQAIGRLDTLNPTRFLVPLLAAFDEVAAGLAALDLTSFLRPLDDLHRQHLQMPLAALKASVLLQPVAAAFPPVITALNSVSGAALIAPLNAQLNALKGAVTGLDVAAFVDDLLAAVARVQQDLESLRPSTLLEPLAADFDRLEAELDRFKPSVLFQPVVELATPLRALLEGMQQEAVTALFEAFQAPLAVLDRLEPAALTQHIQTQLDAVLSAVNALQIPSRINQLKAAHFDLGASVQAGGNEARIALVGALDPQRQLGEFSRLYQELAGAIAGLRQNLALPDLAALHSELRTRLVAMLPPFARELLDVETFQRVMRLADPSRFLAELDQRFDALKNRLLPIRPRDLIAQLDATYASVLALVEGLDIADSLTAVRDLINRFKAVIAGVRVDFVAADIDRALGDVRAVVRALDIAPLFAELDAIHAELGEVVAATVPSTVLAGLNQALAPLRQLVGSFNLGPRLQQPLELAWESVAELLTGIDFTIVLKPLVDELNAIEEAFFAALARVEAAFDAMLAAARTALSGGGSVSVGVTV